jgi:hypothetical protein
VFTNTVSHLLNNVLPAAREYAEAESSLSALVLCPGAFFFRGIKKDAAFS